MDDYKEYRLNQMTARSRDNFLALVRCASRDPEGHALRLGKSGVKTKPYGLQVILSLGHEPCPAVNEDWDLGHWLGDNGFAEIGDGGWRGPLRFRQEILAWYRENHLSTNAHIQQAIAGHYYALGTSGAPDDALVPFDPEALAGKIAYHPSRVHENVRALVGAGVLRDAGSGSSGVPPYYVLTPQGFQWFLGGCKADMGLVARVEVNVSLQQEIEQTINVIAQLPISDEQKRAYELIVLKLERELTQGKLSWGTFKDALTAAADGQTVGLTLFKLLADHKDAILSALSRLPIG